MVMCYSINVGNLIFNLFNVVVKSFNLLKPAETPVSQNHCPLNYMSKLKGSFIKPSDDQQIKPSPCTLTVKYLLGLRFG